MNKSKLLVLATISLVVTATISVASGLSIESAEERLKATLGKIENTTNPNIQVESKKIEVPDVKGINHQVPEFKYYGNQSQSVDPMAVAKRFEQTHVPDANLKEKTDLIAFVSFSMPDASLKRIAAESSKAGAVMVIRGFKDHSLKATMAATEEIAALGGKLLIHPDLFNQYSITEVPTFVLAKTGEALENSCATDDNLCSTGYQVKGDVSLHAVLEYFEKLEINADLTEAAKTRLAYLRGEK